LSQLESRYQDGAFADYEEEFLPYLSRFSDDSIFPDAERLEAVLKEEDADIKALDMAIEAEEKFSAYFQKASELAQSDDGREAFAWLAGEETRHARILKERRSQLIAD